MKPINPSTLESPLLQEPPCSETLTARLLDLSAAGSRDAEIECTTYRLQFRGMRNGVSWWCTSNHLLFKSMGEGFALFIDLNHAFLFNVLLSNFSLEKQTLPSWKLTAIYMEKYAQWKNEQTRLLSNIKSSGMSYQYQLFYEHQKLNYCSVLAVRKRQMYVNGAINGN